MPISFEKRLTQNYCKNIAEANRALAPNNKYDFKDYQLTDYDCIALKPMAIVDAKGFYFNALVSFLHGCHSIMNGCVSWACVELYYSIYYALRAQFYYQSYVLIRDNSLYLLKIAKDEHPIRHGNKKYNTDHGGTMNFFIDKYGDSDFLCSNTIDTMNVYEWLMDLRETTNYRHKYFNEPGCFEILNSLTERITNEGISMSLKDFRNDFRTYCFSDAHAWLCAPYYKLTEIAALYKANDEKFSPEQESYIDRAIMGMALDIHEFI